MCTCVRACARPTAGGAPGWRARVTHTLPCGPPFARTEFVLETAAPPLALQSSDGLVVCPLSLLLRSPAYLATTSGLQVSDGDTTAPRFRVLRGVGAIQTSRVGGSGHPFVSRVGGSLSSTDHRTIPTTDMLETSAPPRPPGRSLSAPTAGRALDGALAKRSWRCAAGCQLVLMAALADLFLRRGLLLVALSHLVAHPPRAAARA